MRIASASIVVSFALLIGCRSAEHQREKTGSSSNAVVAGSAVPAAPETASAAPSATATGEEPNTTYPVVISVSDPGDPRAVAAEQSVLHNEALDARCAAAGLSTTRSGAAGCPRPAGSPQDWGAQ